METIDQQYQVLKTLGQGLAGEVYLVAKGPKNCALKLLKGSIAQLSPEEATSHFKAEFSVLKQLSHPHIAAILDFGTDASSSRPYYTSEFIEGADLYAATRSLKPEEIEGLLVQALRALEYLQAHGVAHYDLKPENLLVDSKKHELKIIDFGMAGFRPRGQLAGTPAYMAPEIILGITPDPRADLYSLGVTFYECLTGENPFRAKGLAEILKRQETLLPPPAKERNKEISEALSELLAQLMAKNPADRPATAGAALRIFAQLSGKKISRETEATSLSYLPNETKLIGRKNEIEIFQRNLQEVLEKNSAEPVHRLIFLAGEEGIGKSRLMKEMRFASQLAGLRTFVPQDSEIPEVGENFCLLLDDARPDALQKISLQAAALPSSTLIIAAGQEKPKVSLNAEILPLRPFGKSEIEEYLSALTGLAEPPKNLVEEMERRSGGSPRFLTEVLGEIIRHGGLLDENGRWTRETLEDLGIDFDKTRESETMRRNFQRDLKELDAPAQEILKWLALAPRPVPADFLARASDVEDFPYWLLELLNQGLLRREEISQAYVITNPYFQAFLETQMPAAEREGRHRKWAEVLLKHPAWAEARLYHRGRGGKTAEAQKALMELVKIQEGRGQYAEAYENLKLADQIPTEDLKDAYDIKMQIAVCLILLKRQPEALEYLNALASQLAALPKTQMSTRIKIATYEKLGLSYLRGGALPKARESFQTGVELAQTLEKEFPQKKIIFKNYLGRLLYEEGRLQEAKKILQESFHAWKDLKPEQQKTVTNNDLGVVLLKLGKMKEAKQQLTEELRFLKSVGEEYYQARCLYNLAEVEAAQKNYESAKQNYQQSIELAKTQRNFEILLRAYNGLGNLYEQRHEYSKSLDYYERALAIAQKIGDFISQASIETNLGIVSHAADQLQKAIPPLKAAIHLLNSLASPEAFPRFLLARAKLELGEIYLKTRELQKSQELLEEIGAMAKQEEALKILNFPIQMALAKLYTNSGRSQEAEGILQEWKTKKLNEEEKIELAKTENYVRQGPVAREREPAITLGGFAPRPTSEPSVFLTPSSEGAYAKLLELTRYINAETNLDFVLKMVLQYALELSGAERGLLLLLNDRDRLEIRAALNTAVNPNLSEISTKVAEQVLQTGEMIETDDATQDERFNEYQSVMILKLRAILCLPIHSRNKTVGVLYLDHRYRPKAFGKDQHPLLQAFCDQAGIAIENAKLFEKFERAQAKLKQRLEKAEEEAEHFHELLGEGLGKLPTKYAYDNIVARTKSMHEVFKVLDKITETNISVFIHGETGTGKELIAKALHYNNKERAQKRFVAINCGGLPPNLIESELFGYKAGAFTGATKDKKGLFVEADGGTLFMDEVAELDMGLQVKLLRALQEGEVLPIGETRPLKFDIRVVSASHKNLEELISQQKFREDLFYRICQIRLSLPPLRERREDIPLLAEKFVQDYAKEHHLKKTPKFSGNLMKKLMQYDWPGNVRELENTLRVACALSDGKEITARDIPEQFGTRLFMKKPEGPSAVPAGKMEAEDLRKTPIDAFNRYDPRLRWEEYEKKIFAKAYAAADFKPLPAAESLEISPATFYKRIKDFDLNNRANPLYKDNFVFTAGKSLREYLEDIFLAAYQCSSEKAYTAIKWLGVSQGHFYNVLKAAKGKRG